MDAQHPQQVIADINRFWDWFLLSEDRIRVRYMSSHGQEELDAQIAALGPIAWELGPDPDEVDRLMLAFSPSGNVSLLPLTREIVHRAPIISGWTWYPAKPRKIWNREFTLDVAGQEVHVNANTWRYVLLALDRRHYDVTFFIEHVEGLSHEDELLAAEIALTGEIGEMERITLIDRVIVLHRPSHIPKSISFAYLREHLMSLAES